MSTPKADAKERNGFTFFRSFRDAVEMTDRDDQLVLYKAIANYALDGVEPDVSALGALGRLCWTAIRPNIKSGIIRYRNGCNGGAPIGNRNAQKQPKNNQDSTGKQPKNNQKTTKKQPKNNQKTTYPLKDEDEDVDEDVDDKIKKLPIGSKESAGKPRPSPETIKDYFLTIGGTDTDAKSFYDYYTANGWRTGRNTIKDWRAAARNWMNRKPKFNKPAKTTDHETTRKYNFL